MNFEMCKLVEDDILDNFCRRHDQPPGEIERASTAARTPPRGCAGDMESLKFQSTLVGKIQGADRNDKAGLLPVPFDKFLPSCVLRAPV